MKQFLYLDTDIVNSIIAQSDQGLIQSFTDEQVSSDTESDSSKIVANVKAQLGGSLAKLVKAEANLSGNLESVESNSSIATSREIISKTMHDAAFSIAYNHIKPTVIEYGNQNEDDTGNYIEMKRVFDFVDFDYLEGLFEKDGIVEYIKKVAAEKIEIEAEKVREGYNREQLRQIGSKFKTEVKKVIDESNKSYDEISTILKVLRKLMPYNRMLISNDGYLIPLNTRYFRVDPIDLGFKYGGEITCVGMITNIIGEDTDSNDDNNIFATLQYTVNNILRKILPTSQSNLCVIHPIAIYYGD